MSRLLTLDIPDKKFHEHWYRGRKLLNIPPPFAMLNIGLPNTGKTTITYNIIAAAQPVFQYIFLVHPDFFQYRADKEEEEKDTNPLIEYDKDGKDPDGNERVSEYKEIKYIGLKWFPSTKYWSGNTKYSSAKKLLIIDDIDVRAYIKVNPKLRHQRVTKLYSYSVTHSNLSVITCLQDVHTQGMPSVYRMCNFFSIFPYHDKFQVSIIARSVGVDAKQLIEMFSYCRNPHDSIQIDRTIGSPMPYRLNFIHEIQLNLDSTINIRKRGREPPSLPPQSSDDSASELEEDYRPKKKRKKQGGKVYIPTKKLSHGSLEYMKRLMKKVGHKTKVY